MRHKSLRILLIGVLFIALVLVRVFESKLFYDPYILFYKSHNSVDILKKLNFNLLLLNVFYRYLLNTILSIAVLYIAFNKKDILRFCTLFYCGAFIVLITAYTITENTLTEDTYQLFFYIRRFLIQPIFVLLLLPAFYYQKLHK